MPVCWSKDATAKESSNFASWVEQNPNQNSKRAQELLLLRRVRKSQLRKDYQELKDCRLLCWPRDPHVSAPFSDVRKEDVDSKLSKGASTKSLHREQILRANWVQELPSAGATAQQCSSRLWRLQVLYDQAQKWRLTQLHPFNQDPGTTADKRPVLDGLLRELQRQVPGLLLHQDKATQNGRSNRPQSVSRTAHCNFQHRGWEVSS